MTQAANEAVQALTDLLNQYRYAYYDLCSPAVSDADYDQRLSELVELEKRTGIVMTNSPTRHASPFAGDKLERTAHTIQLPLLKTTKSVKDVCRFIGDHQIAMMPKLNGMLLKLSYENGKLMEAASRGDGNVGEIVTHQTCAVSGIPAQIQYQGRLVVIGEVFIRPGDFERLRTTLVNEYGETYKTGPDLAAGTMRRLEPFVSVGRCLSFMAYDVLEGFEEFKRVSERLNQLPVLGFQRSRFIVNKRPLQEADVESGVKQIVQYARGHDLPIQGIVVMYNDTGSVGSNGKIGPERRSGLVYESEDKKHETTLRSIEWETGRTGEIVPAAVFDPVEIDGQKVSRANLRDLSYIASLELMPGNRILVSREDMITPCVVDNLNRGGFKIGAVISPLCPCCNDGTRIIKREAQDENGQDRIVMTAFCDNADCDSRHLKHFLRFVGSQAMDIDEMTDTVLEKLIGKGWVHSCLDIYRLDRHKDAIIQMQGFDTARWDRLWEAIQKSRDTTFERFLAAMDIPLIDQAASTVLGKIFQGSLDQFCDAVLSGYDFRKLPGFDDAMHNSIHEWFGKEENFCVWEDLREVIRIAKPASSSGQG